MEMNLKTKIKGHVLIKDARTDEVLLDKFNAIHPANMAKVLARGLANEDNHQIFRMEFGNGGTNIDSTGNIIYLSPNTEAVDATLHNTTYGDGPAHDGVNAEEVVDIKASNTGAGNSVISQAGNELTSLVICTVQLKADEPNGQAATDSNTTNSNSAFTFDELGLKTYDGLLLSHIIFNPIEKNAQRELIISYTLTISVSPS